MGFIPPGYAIGHVSTWQDVAAAHAVVLRTQHRIVQVLVPVDFLRAGNVARIVKQDILVALDDSDVRIVEMLGEPISAHENFGVDIALATDVRIDAGSVG